MHFCVKFDPPPNRYFNNPCHFHLYFYIMYWVSVGWKTSVFFFTSVFSSSNYFSSFFWWSFNCRKFFYVAGSTTAYHSKTSQLKILPTRDCSESKQKITRFLSQVSKSFPSWHPISRNAPSFIPSNPCPNSKISREICRSKLVPLEGKVGLFLGGETRQSLKTQEIKDSNMLILLIAVGYLMLFDTSWNIWLILSKQNVPPVSVSNNLHYHRYKLPLTYSFKEIFSSKGSSPWNRLCMGC